MSDGPIDDGFNYSFYFTQPYNNYLNEIENDKPDVTMGTY